MKWKSINVNLKVVIFFAVIFIFYKLAEAGAFYFDIGDLDIIMIGYGVPLIFVITVAIFIREVSKNIKDRRENLDSDNKMLLKQKNKSIIKNLLVIAMLIIPVLIMIYYF